MPLHYVSFLTTDCNKDHQATLPEKGTYYLSLLTSLIQKLQFCKHFLKVSIKILGILFYLHIKTPTSSEYAENVLSLPLLVAETIAKKYSNTMMIITINK